MPSVEDIKRLGAGPGYDVGCPACARRDPLATVPTLARLLKRPGDEPWSVLPLRRVRPDGRQRGRAPSYFYSRIDDHAPVECRCHRCKKRYTLNPAELGRGRDPLGRGVIFP